MERQIAVAEQAEATKFPTKVMAFGSVLCGLLFILNFTSDDVEMHVAACASVRAVFRTVTVGVPHRSNKFAHGHLRSHTEKTNRQQLGNSISTKITPSWQAQECISQLAASVHKTCGAF